MASFHVYDTVLQNLRDKIQARIVNPLTADKLGKQKVG